MSVSQPSDNSHSFCNFFPDEREYPPNKKGFFFRKKGSWATIRDFLTDEWFAFFPKNQTVLSFFSSFKLRDNVSEKSKSKVRGRRAGRGKEKNCWVSVQEMLERERTRCVLFFFFALIRAKWGKNGKCFGFGLYGHRMYEKKRKEKPLHQDFGWVVRLFKATSNFFFACFLFFFCCSFPGKEGRNSSIRQRATEGLKEVCKVKWRRSSFFGKVKCVNAYDVFFVFWNSSWRVCTRKKIRIR